MEIVGNLAPDFVLADQNNNLISLSEARGNYLVLYFYPRAMTPGCTTQACHWKEAWPYPKGLLVWGISPDTPERLKTFSLKYGLPFTLLSDPQKTTAKAYGADAFLGVKRSSFIINPQGQVVHQDLKVKAGNHQKDVYHYLREVGFFQ